ncbi:MAG: DUF2585 family protein [Gemmataceae bacterium]
MTIDPKLSATAPGQSSIGRVGRFGRNSLPWFAIAAILAVTAYQLRAQGRRWWCICGQPNLWSGDPTGPHNSQHLFDPYSFTHVLHGLVFYWLLAWTFRRLACRWRLVLAVVLASLWEIFENSAFTIQRYRAATAAVGYQGDSVANSLGDILSCALGFLVAAKIGFRWSIALFFATEAILLLWIRDDLLFSIAMLVYPISWIKEWQLGL